MPDALNLGERAVAGLDSRRLDIPCVTPLEMRVTNGPRDSQHAAELMRDAGAQCIVVLGGDGTVRAVSKGAGQVPLLALSTGTNNVLPAFVEGTIAGVAAGAVARGQVPIEAVALRHKWLELFVNGASCDRALVDAVALYGRFVGSRAVWEIEDMRELIVTRADPASIGMSAIAAAIRPLTEIEPAGLALALGGDGGRRIWAAIAPGLVREVTIRAMRTLNLGDAVDIVADEPMVLALDGEREVVLRKGDRAALVLRADGPWMVDTRRVMEEMVTRHQFDRGPRQ